MLKFLLLFIAIVQVSSAKVAQGEFKKDFYTSLDYFFKGSYTQFTTKTNLYYLAPTIGTTWYAFEEDRRHSEKSRQKKIPKHIDLTGHIGIPLNFPIVHTGAYFLGKKSGDQHMMQFAMEYFSAMYLTLLETGAISYIHVHDRPVAEDVSFWEEAFRQESSFPSGHVVPYTVLFFKTFQFYGPYWAIIPGVLSYWASLQRMRDGKHYLSDILGAFWLSAFASEGVRKVAGYNKNHSLYRFIFEHDAKIGLLRHRGAYGPKIVFSF